MHTIDVIVPTLGRADRLARVAENIHAATDTPHIVTFVAERDDEGTGAAVEEIQRTDPGVRLVLNARAKNYVGAINTAVPSSTAEWWFAGADDLRFHPGWDVTCLAAATPSTRVVGTNDLTDHPEVLAGTTATHFLVASSYSRRPGGTVDCGPDLAGFEGYRHWGFDSELVGVARSRGVFTPCLDAAVEHVHWLVGKAEIDATYEKNRASIEYDATLFEQRRHLWETPT